MGESSNAESRSMSDLERELRNNLEIVFEKVEKACERAGRKREEVKVLGASKGQSVEKIQIVHKLGIKLFGENYVQEAERKIALLKELPIEWHFIGRLQTNKVKKAIKLFHVIESVDRIELIDELEKRLLRQGTGQKVLIEVNVGKELSKGGVREEELEKLVERLSRSSSLEVCGLMCLPPWSEDPQKSRPYFQKMRKLFEDLKPIFGQSFTELSMGTSHDFEIAIEEGATIVRIGTLLFGSRT